MIDPRHEVPDVLLAMLLIVDVGGRAVPPHDFAFVIKERRGAAEMPGVSFANRKQAVLHFVGDRGLPGAKPGFRPAPPSPPAAANCRPEGGNALRGFAIPARFGAAAQFATPTAPRSWPRRRRGCRTHERRSAPWRWARRSAHSLSLIPGHAPGG